ncbi:MAG: hypothetical protein ACI87F_000048, partial [Candidatus Azotimanducaceae bacterium]
TGLTGNNGADGTDGDSAYEIYATNNTDPDLSEADWLESLKGERQEGPMMYTVTEGEDISTTSTDNLLVTGMTVTPTPGTYIALFNAQMSSDTQSFDFDRGVADLTSLYNELNLLVATSTHALDFGTGEVLSPGVYDVNGAVTISGTLTLDGGGDPDSIFIIRAIGVFGTEAGATVELTGNAKPENIFWLSDAAMSTGAGTTMKGSMLAGGTNAGAIGLGADTNFSGRLFTKLGAIILGANNIITVPTNNGPFNLGILSTFAMWTSDGGVSDSASSVIRGDLGTAEGELTIYGLHAGEKYAPGSSANYVTTTTYSVYLNGVEVANSSRTIKLDNSIVSLQAMVTVSADNHPVEIRWKVSDGQVSLGHRILTLIRNGY